MRAPFIVWRYLATEFVRAFLGTLAAICAIFLVIDFVDRAKAYTGEGWQRDAAILYGYKAITVAYQLAPAALLLAGAIAVAGFRRRGEYTAMRALSISPLQLLVPIALVAGLIVSGMMIADELVVGSASRHVDDITTSRFHSYGDWRTFFGQTSWFRGKRHIYHLREGDADEGFRKVTIFTLSDDFRLARRIDAREMKPLQGRTWRLVDGRERTLGEGSELRPFATLDLTFDEEPTSFRIAKGRPEQLPLRSLVEQITLRENVGLPVERYLLALHNKAAYPLAGLPAALLAATVTLRPGRKGYLTEAVADGFFVILWLWALMVISKAAALAGYVSAGPAAWGPVLVMALLASIAAFRSAR